MKALCLVAHPDDCVIFAYSFMYHHPQFDWTVGYLTYTSDTPRGQEFVKFWTQRDTSTVFLGFEDDWHDNEQKKLLHWTQQDAINACQQLAQDYDLVLTHDHDGDYGHIHHEVVYESVANHPGLITFARPGTGTNTYQVPLSAYNPGELPLHADVIKGFHYDIHSNSYHVSAYVNQLIKDHK